MLNIVFGGAGFIGSNLVRHFKDNGQRVIVFDDMSLGSLENINFLDGRDIVIGDINCDNAIEILELRIRDLNPNDIKVWHLAANSDIVSGVDDSNVDFKKTFLTTQNILKFMRRQNLTKLYFSSTSAVYGDKGEQPIAETSPSLHPISNYGAYKLASEAIISAAREDFLVDVVIFRFPNVVGTPATHGVILDFFNKLKENPDQLLVLGDGSQKKSYIYIDDLISAMLLCTNLTHSERLPIFNIGNIDDGTLVREIAEIVVNKVSPNAQIKYGTEPRGWKGDVPRFNYNISKIEQLGWQPLFTSSEAIKRTIENMMSDE